MKAVFFEEHGEPDVLQYGELPTPTPNTNQVLVRLRAAALNRLDSWVRQGWEGIKLDYPHIPGADGAGEIAELGPGVQDWQVGDRVVINANISCGACAYCTAGQDNRCRRWHLIGEHINGTCAQYLVVPARNLLAVPNDVDLTSAAAAALVFQTAWHSLITRGGLRAGETVLVVGASGGVNTASIQIARLAGAKVFVVGSTDAKLDLAKALGAEVLINRQEKPDWEKAVYYQTRKRGVDVVIDNVGTTFQRSFRAAKKGGRILTVGNTGGAQFEFDNRFMFAKHLTLIGSTMAPRSDFEQVMKLVFSGTLQAVLDKTFPLAEAQLAHLRLEENNQMGKITLSIP